MFAVDHAATALLIKRRFPTVPLAPLLLSVQAMEVAWVVLNYLGVERTTTEATVRSVADIHLAYMPYSHSVATAVGAALLAWLIVEKGLGRPLVARVIGIGIVSHLVLDVLTHAHDIALWPGSTLPSLGLGLYDRAPMWGFALEIAYGVVCWRVYRGSRPSPPGFFGADLPGIHVSPELTEFVIRQCLDCSARATVQFFLTGFTADLRDQLRLITVPALIVHGDHDIQAPLELCGRKTARLVPQSTLRVYENAAHGLFVTHADRLNADLLAFARGNTPTTLVTGQATTNASLTRRPLLAATIEEGKTVTQVQSAQIDFLPAQATGIHRHPVPVVGLVTRGVFQVQVDGEPARMLTAGTAFYEPANARILHFRQRIGPGSGEHRGVLSEGQGRPRVDHGVEVAAAT